jgi:hypothetical protein
MTRVLIFSPYASRPHLTSYEGTIAKACQIRGANIDYLLCDSLLPECDMHWDSFPYNRPRPFDLCQRCQTGARARLIEFDLPYRWLGEYVSQKDREHSFIWAQGLSPSEMLQARFMEYPIGNWVLSSVTSYFRQYPPDMKNWRVVNVYRGFLYSASIVTMGLKRYLEVHPTDSAILFNGRQSITRVAFELFQEFGIRVLTHEYPFFKDGHLMLKPNARCWSPSPFEEFWRMWGQVPLTRPALEKTLEWLKSRRYGKGMSWYAFNNPYIGPLAIRKELNLSKKKRIMALFTSSTDETAGDNELQGAYESQSSWVQDIIDWVKDKNDVELVIRVHPHLSGRTGLGRAEDEYDFYRKLISASPTNVRIVMPDNPLNSYALMDEADIGLTYGSSVGIEMAMLGKPIVLGSRSFYENGTHIFRVRSKEELPDLLDRSLQSVSAREIRREAFRLAYYQVFKFELPFPLVRKTGVMEVALNYTSPEALAPGMDDTIDHACNFLIEGHPLFDPPDDEALARTTAEEDAFFEEIEHSQEMMRDRDYESWLKLGVRINTLGRSIRGAMQRLPFGAGFVFNKLGKGIFLPFLHWMKRRI